MKKFFAVPLSLLAVGTAFAALNPVAELNAEIAKMLAPFQNETTAAGLSFSKIETNSERALAAGVALLYRKVGAQNTLEVNIPNLSYEYGDGSSPLTKANGTVKIDLTKLISQEELNELIPGLEELIVDMAKGLVQDYGDAISVTAQVSEKGRDANGNYTSVSGTVSFAFDFSKLPQGQDVKDIPVVSGSVMIGLDVSSGLVFDLSLVSNTAYRGFDKDELGLKEVLDALLSRDPQVMEQMKAMFVQLDEMAAGILN